MRIWEGAGWDFIIYREEIKDLRQRKTLWWNLNFYKWFLRRLLSPKEIWKGLLASQPPCKGAASFSSDPCLAMCQADLARELCSPTHVSCESSGELLARGCSWQVQEAYIYPCEPDPIKGALSTFLSIKSWRFSLDNSILKFEVYYLWLPSWHLS